MITFRKLTTKEMMDRSITKYTFINPILVSILVLMVFATTVSVFDISNIQTAFLDVIDFGQ